MLSMIENRTEILPVWIFENGQSTWLNSRIQGQMVPIFLCVLIPTTKVWPYSWWDSVPHHNSTQVLFLFLYASVNFVLSLQSLSPVRLCDPMNRSTPGLPVHHQLPEITQTHVH